MKWENYRGWQAQAWFGYLSLRRKMKQNCRWPGRVMEKIQSSYSERMRTIQEVTILGEKVDVPQSVMEIWMLVLSFLNSMAFVGWLIQEIKIITKLKRQVSTFGLAVRIVSDGI